MNRVDLLLGGFDSLGNSLAALLLPLELSEFLQRKHCLRIFHLNFVCCPSFLDLGCLRHLGSGRLRLNGFEGGRLHLSFDEPGRSLSPEADVHHFNLGLRFVDRNRTGLRLILNCGDSGHLVLHLDFRLHNCVNCDNLFSLHFAVNEVKRQVCEFSFPLLLQSVLQVVDFLERLGLRLKFDRRLNL